METISNAIQADASGEARNSWDLWMFIPKIEWINMVFFKIEIGR